MNLSPNDKSDDLSLVLGLSTWTSCVADSLFVQAIIGVILVGGCGLLAGIISSLFVTTSFVVNSLRSSSSCFTSLDMMLLSWLVSYTQITVLLANDFGQGYYGRLFPDRGIGKLLTLCSTLVIVGRIAIAYLAVHDVRRYSILFLHRLTDVIRNDSDLEYVLRSIRVTNL